MENLPFKSDEKNSLKILANHRVPFFVLLLSFLLSGTALYPQSNNVGNDNSVKKRQEILEKLENGKSINSSDIRDLFNHRSYAEIDNEEINDPDIEFESPFFVVPPESYQFYYNNHDGKEHSIISDSDLKEIHDYLQNNMAEIRKNIETLRNSDEFKKMQEDFKKLNDDFRKELEKIKDELKRSEKETESKNIIESQV